MAKSAKQFNVVTGSVFNGNNEESCLEAIKQHGYKSNKWITYPEAAKRDMNTKDFRKRGVRLQRFVKKDGKTIPVWYSVFNLDLCQNVPEELSKKRAPSASQKPKAKASKKAKKQTVKQSAPQAQASQKPAIPVQGEPGFYLVPDANGVYNKVELGS